LDYERRVEVETKTFRQIEAEATRDAMALKFRGASRVPYFPDGDLNEA
jgi:hypothetical protein